MFMYSQYVCFKIYFQCRPVQITVISTIFFYIFAYSGMLTDAVVVYFDTVTSCFYNRILQISVLSWLRHYATSPKVAGSISDEVIGFF
jgi:hypothetical protein